MEIWEYGNTLSGVDQKNVGVMLYVVCLEGTITLYCCCQIPYLVVH